MNHHKRQPAALVREAELDDLIAKRPSDLLERLRESLEDDDEEVRSTVAYGLAELHDPRAIPMLIRMVDDDPSEHVVDHALKSLEAYVSPDILDVLLREAGRTRKRRSPMVHVARQLGRYDTDDSVAALVRLLSHWDVFVRDDALESLIRLRPSQQDKWEHLYMTAAGGNSEPAG